MLKANAASSAALQLRDYQVEALDATREAYAAGCWSQVWVVPTGGGKTVMFSQLRKQLATLFADIDDLHYKVLVLAHREELLTQARDKMLDANPELFVEIEQADAHASPFADVVIASVQTLAARDCQRLERFDLSRFKIVIVDEAHHVPADTYQAILRRLGLVPPIDIMPKGKHAHELAAARQLLQQWRRATQPGKLLIGVTATPDRADAKGLEWTFERVVFERSLLWMIQRGYLVPPKGFQVDTGVDLDGVKTIGDDFAQKQLATAVNTPERNRAIVAAWMDKAHGRRTIGFGVDVQHAKDLAAAFHEAGVKAAAIDGSAERAARAALLGRFRSDDVRALMNCALYTEGFDEPSIGCVVLARPTKSRTLYSQMVGRGLRLFDAKADCIVIDGVDNASRHSLVTLGDLFGLPPRFNLQGQNAAKVQERLEQVRAEMPELDLAGALSVDDIRARIKAIDLFGRQRSRTVEQHAALLWIEQGKDRYMLPIPAAREQNGQSAVTRAAASAIVIEQGTLGDWTVKVRASGTPSYQVAICGDVDEAFRTGERWLMAHHPDVARLNDKQAPWRRQAPSMKQLQQLTAWGCKEMPSTRGEASDMITSYLQRKTRGRATQ